MKEKLNKLIGKITSMVKKFNGALQKKIDGFINFVQAIDWGHFWKKNKKIVVISIPVLMLIVAGVVVFSPAVTGPKLTEKGETDYFSGSKLIGTYGVGDMARLGNMEITLVATEEGEYNSFDRDSAGNRIQRGYYLAKIKIFNAGQGITYKIHHRLLDDKKGMYKTNYSIASFTEKTPFGIDINSYPRTIREGYLMFQDINKDAEELTLEFVIESTQEKIAFIIPR